MCRGRVLLSLVSCALLLSWHAPAPVVKQSLFTRTTPTISTIHFQIEGINFCFSMMTDFPQGGDAGATRAWLDQEGYVGLFTGWEANTLLRTSEEDVKSRFGSSPEDQQRAEMLWGFLDTARRSPQPQAGKNCSMMQASDQASITISHHHSPSLHRFSTYNSNLSLSFK